MKSAVVPSVAPLVTTLDVTAAAHVVLNATADAVAAICEMRPSDDTVAPLIGPRPVDDVVVLSAALAAALGDAVDGEFRHQAQRMPLVSRRLLLEGVSPSDVRPEELLADLHLDEPTAAAARRGLDSASAVVRVPGLLPPAACARLRAAVDAERQQKCDSVDGAPDHQLNLSPARLEQLIGSEAAEALWQLAGAGARDDAELFVRRYTADSRPWTPFHVDTSRATINVALSDDASHGGGDLLACYDGAVRRVGRGEGEATVHAATLLHGVSLMRSGVRYSLIVFVGRRAEDATSAADGAAEAEALAALLADDVFGARCVRALGSAGTATARARYARLRERADLGVLIERVVARYNAAHLRPTEIGKGTVDAVAYSLRALLTYAEELDADG